MFFIACFWVKKSATDAFLLWIKLKIGMKALLDTEFPLKIKEGNLRVCVEYTKNQTFDRIVISTEGGLVMEIHNLERYQRGGKFFDQTLFLLPVGIPDGFQCGGYYLSAEYRGIGVYFK
ncbi:hypothetical protein P4H61_22465 [Paenibacillus peoriae]|uniref:hypothetical protein n=1 Tax=Paenibacillus peoriae TaxID=59893 RepID=UPI001110626E|nr:hypothetical protein [Paenibacillus peoriae]MEC0184252.1 hypothetical protein [Paenibacillus peoriae]